MKKTFFCLLACIFFNQTVLAQSQIEQMIANGIELYDNKEFSKAEGIFSQVQKLLEDSKNTNTAEYATCLFQIARCLGAQEKFAKAKEYAKDAVDLRKEILGELNDDYILALNNYAWCICWLEDYTTARNLQLKVIELTEKLDHEHPKKFLLYDNMARYSILAGDANNCLKYWSVALSCVEKYGKDYETVLKALDYIAASDRITDKQVKKQAAILINDFNEHELRKENVTVEDLPEKAKWLAQKGELDKARNVFIDVLKMDLTHKQRMNSEEAYAEFLWSSLKDNTSAAEHYLKASEIALQTEGKTDHYNNIIYMAYLCYQLDQNTTMADKCKQMASDFISKKIEESRSIRKEKEIQEKSLTAEESNANNLKETKDILDFSLDAIETYGNYMSDIDYAQSLGVISESYMILGNYDEAVKYAEKYISKLTEALRHQFRTLDYKQRTKIWKEEESFNINSVKVLYATVEDKLLKDRMNAVIYDVELLSKGFLLNSSISFNKVIEQSNDAKLKADYQTMLKMDKELEDMRKEDCLTEEEESDILNSIRKKSTELEKLQLSIFKKCAEFADYTEYMSFKWQDVQKNLKNTDVAIEFALIGNEEELISLDKRMMAFIITKDLKQPESVYIANCNDLRLLLQKENAFTDPSVGSIVWGKLEPYMKDKKRVFFSADNLFNSIGVEYLHVEGKPICERYDMYRLSSTKELCMKHKPTDIKNVVLIGDIDYGESSGEINKETQRKLIAMRGFRESAGGFAQLPYSKKEIEELEKIYSKSKTIILKKQEASENAFRLLDDKKINLLHIATHGSYDPSIRLSEDDAMTSSILALSGANNGDNEETNDGIISAADIASMNLRHCEIAILSACQTGLGKLGDEGVFGLQRGFKNAGVHSLLITLSPVYDESTAMLMEQFHKNLTKEKMSKHEALRVAQTYLREHGFDDPSYWSVFILLDAID